MNEFKQLLKGRWDYNILDNKLTCKNKTGLTYIFENKDDIMFNNLISTLNSKCKANPNIIIDYEKPVAEVPFELLYRVLRSNEVLYEQIVGLRETSEGLFCFSNVTKNFRINHHEYEEELEVYVDPQRICKILRKIQDRNRVHAMMKLEPKRIIIECTFPWTVLTIIVPTVHNITG